MRNSLIIAVVLILCGCKEESSTPDRLQPERIIADAIEHPEQARYGKLKLSDYGFFTGELRHLEPGENVVPYAVNAPLFSDYATKKRFIYLPEGTAMSFHPKEAFAFPDGAILIKNFMYTDEQVEGDDRIIETRLLLKENGEWSALPYIWNNAQTEAFLDVTGAKRTVHLTDREPFTYVVPNFKQCKTCHDLNGQFTPIGPTARQLDNGKRLHTWENSGILKTIDAHDGPVLADYHNEQIDLNHRARSYLDGNCGYCHRPGGSAKNSGLDLRMYSPSSFALGVMKGPVAAGKGSGGRAYDIVPGKPEQSILHYRMNATDPAVMMPELGRTLIHAEGVQLIEEWIANFKSEQL